VRGDFYGGMKCLEKKKKRCNCPKKMLGSTQDLVEGKTQRKISLSRHHRIYSVQTRRAIKPAWKLEDFSRISGKKTFYLKSG